MSEKEANELKDENCANSSREDSDKNSNGNSFEMDFEIVVPEGMSQASCGIEKIGKEYKNKWIHKGNDNTSADIKLEDKERWTNNDVYEDQRIHTEELISDCKNGKTHLQDDGLYSTEEKKKERENNHVMKKEFHKIINDNIMDKLVHRTFNNIMKDTSNECGFIVTPDTPVARGTECHHSNHKRSAPLFDNPVVKKEKINTIKKEKEEKFETDHKHVGYNVVSSTCGNRTKTRIKNEPVGIVEMEMEMTDDESLLEYSRMDNNSYLQKGRYRKKFEDENDIEMFPYEAEGEEKVEKYTKKNKLIYGKEEKSDRIIGKLSDFDSVIIDETLPEIPLGSNSDRKDNNVIHKDENEANNKEYLHEISSIIYDKNGNDNYIDEENQVGIDQLSFNKKEKGYKNKIKFPSIYENNREEWFQANENDEWMVHKLCDWIYNVKDKLYFNLQTQGIYYTKKNGEFLKFENSFHEREDTVENEKEVSRETPSNYKSMNRSENNSLSESEFDDADMNRKYKARAYCKDLSNNDDYECIDVDTLRWNDNKDVKPSAKDEHGRNIASKNIYKDDKRKKKNCNPGNGHMSRDHDERIKNVSINSLHASYTHDNQSHDETVEEFSMVLEDDLVCGTYSEMGIHNKGGNEDFYVTKDILDLNDISESDGLCFFSGVFDGHGGSNCARYVMSHLKTNLIAKFRQSFLITCKKQFKEKTSKLNDLSVEIRALYDSCIKGFDMTDKNYIELSKKYDYRDGSTACVVLIYGPDDDGSLKVLCANCGDSGALICHNRDPVKLSLRHKPDLQEERLRILKCGGIIANINGINRIITKHNVKDNKSREKTFLALSTSRSFGDISYKIPRKIVLSKPFISIYTIDFDLDSFLVLATDGILNVLTNKEIIDIVWNNIHRKPEEAAEEVVKEATKRGSTDDKTCTVIFFYWRKDIFRDAPEDVNPDPSSPLEDSKAEDINMFSEVF
ncbi:protein phosphatase 2C domain containing protein [Plasmodium gonderi]|uniref:Protein phosphatase 2C domain containing protein n=1 Tax=Plasmodium gonderi TaxID=77519 RepID=A0A1Y1JMP2_PLAGO|nr:protein phosphatase 2C domain containing protein [Plasmodium gonderi]GAW83856.1 protein phosphatase 2C domain containing protein [Plasmodium gonderi]